MSIHVYVALKLVIKRKGWSRSLVLRRQNWGVYTAICRATSKCVKMPFIVWISWKNWTICSVHMPSEPKDPYWRFSVWICACYTPSSLLYIFFTSVREVHTEFCSQVHRDWDGRKPVVSLFYKSTMFCCYYECTQINVESLQIWNMYYSYLDDQKSDRIGTSICHAVSSLYSAYTPHRHLNSAHFC